MKEVEQLFFELIRVAICPQEALSRLPSEKEWKSLFSMAQKQSLVGVCFAALQHLGADADEGFDRIGMSETLYLTWMGMAATIQHKNGVIDIQCEQIQKRFHEAGFRNCIMKGQRVGELYGPLSEFRQSGDIDVWVEGARRKTMSYVNSVAPTRKVRWHHCHFHVFEDTDVEVHFTPIYFEFPLTDYRAQRFFKKEGDLCFSIGRPTQLFNLVFIVSHIYGHLIGEGVGLRQLMDYYYVLENCVDIEDRQKAYDVLCSLRMNRFLGAVMWVLGYVFGLEREKMLCEPNEKEGRFFLREIMQSGNMGYYDGRVNKAPGESSLHRYWRISAYSFRVFRFAPMEILCSPLWKIWHWCWRKTKGYE